MLHAQAILSGHLIVILWFARSFIQRFVAGNASRHDVFEDYASGAYHSDILTPSAGAALGHQALTGDASSADAVSQDVGSIGRGQGAARKARVHLQVARTCVNTGSRCIRRPPKARLHLEVTRACIQTHRKCCATFLQMCIRTNLHICSVLADPLVLS